MSSSDNLKTFYIVCDTSGSMAENGKRMQVRSVARTIEQYIRLGYGNGMLKLVSWNETASLIEWNPDEDFSENIFDCYGSTNADALCAFFDSVTDGNIILLTDVSWSKDTETVLKKWQRKLAPDTLKIIKIGGETSLSQKQKKVFSSDEILPMLDGWRPLHVSLGGKIDEVDEW